MHAPLVDSPGLLLLQRAQEEQQPWLPVRRPGYAKFPFSSLESAIEQSKDAHYVALR